MSIKISGTTVIDDSRNIQNIGVATATTFVGALTGTATGLSGSPNITVTGVNASGVVTATSFVGSGANLTNLNIPASFNELDTALFS